MAQIRTLKDRLTGEILYPATSAKAVFDDNGLDLASHEAALKAEVKKEVDDRLKVQDAEVAIGLSTMQGKVEAVESELDVAKVKVFNDLWLAAVGEYGGINEDGTYHLNGVMDLSREDAMKIYACTISGFYDSCYAGSNIRTNIYKYNQTNTWGRGIDEGVAPKAIFLDSKIEVARIAKSDKYTLTGTHIATFRGCSKLRRVIGIMAIEVSSRPLLLNCPRLEYVLIKNCGNINVKESALITSECVKYWMLNRNTGTGMCTITLHPDVYAKITDPDNPDYAEWHPLLALAESKNISLATV